MPCAFCGEPFQKPHRPRSKEHAFAQWLEEFIPQEGEEFAQTVRNPEGEVVVSWSSKSLDVVARRVCLPCNTGWMNDSENAARPYLTSLVQGHGRTLYREGQTALATWAVKTALALQLAVPDLPELPAAHYRQLAERKTDPPENTIVWVGGYEGWRHLFFDPQHLTLGSSEGLVDGYQATFIIRHAIFQVFGHTYSEPVAVTKDRTRSNMATQIWPIHDEAVTFPPRIIVSEGTLERFVKTHVGR